MKSMGTLFVLAVIAIGVAAVVWLGQQGAKGTVELAQRDRMQTLNDMFGGAEHVVCTEYDRDGMPEDMVIAEAMARGYKLTRQADDRLYFQKVI